MIRSLVKACVFTAVCAVSMNAYAAEKCDDEAITVTTTPIPPQSARAWKKYKEIAKEANEAPTLVLGDSLAEMWPAEYIDKIWPGRLSLNYGLGGDKTQNVLWRLERPEVTSLRPSQVLLLIGTNNIGAGDPGCAVLEGARAILTKIDGLWPGIATTIIEVPPRGSNFRHRDEERREYNSGLSVLATERANTKSVNVDEAVTCGRYKEEPESQVNSWIRFLSGEGEGQICRNYRPDFLHLTQDGYAQMTNSIILTR